MRTVRFRFGETIISEGTDGDTAFLIVSGSVEVSVGQGAQSKSVASLAAGEVFGEMCLIEPGPRSATVKATTDTECIATSYEEFMAALQNNPAQAAQFMKTLVRRLRQMNRLVAATSPRRRGLSALFQEWQASAPVSVSEVLPLQWTMI